MKVFVLINLFCLLGLMAQAAPVDLKVKSNKSIEQRILDLERQQAEFDVWYSDFYLQSKGRVTPFLSEKISIGGFFESAITHLSGPDTIGQTSANTHALGLNITAEFDESIRFSTQFISTLNYTLENPHNNPALALGQRGFGVPNLLAVVAQGYVEYRKNDAFVLQTGLGYVPFGHAFQQREPVLFKRRGGPHMLAAASGNSVGMAFPLWMGLHLQGIFPTEVGFLGYNLYSFSPSTNPKTLGGGSRFSWSNSKNVTAGISIQTGENIGNSFYSYGTDININLDRMGLVIEYARSVVSDSSKPLVSYYAEPYVNLADGVWLVYLSADYIDNPNHVVGAVNDAYEKWQLGAGLNWLPIPNARFRLGVFNNDYIGDTDSIGGQRRDYVNVDFSVGLAF